ncbi:MAG: Bax inhibitor-1/YccA family protein [Gammaproteobacteria bacterium]|nr:Bax inhibitor-1/YccA family protein [Gammaproteobacteria bacterium]
MPIDLNRRPTGAVPGGYAATVAPGLRAFMQAVYGYMAGGLALTGALAYFAAGSGLYLQLARTPLLFWLVLLAPLGMVMFLGFRIQKMSLAAAQITYWVYAALMGVSLGGVFLVYTGDSIARVFFITAGTFGGMSLYGYTTRSDLTRWGSFLFMGLIGLILASLVNLFLHSSALQFLVSAVGVIVFVGLTAYDTQKIKAMYVESDGHEIAGKKAVFGALALYLDFVNLFLILLRILGGRRG